MKIREMIFDLDIDYLLSLEQANASWINSQGRIEHSLAYEDGAHFYGILCDGEGNAGFFILNSIQRGAVEFKRIVMQTPGRGKGIVAVKSILSFVKERFTPEKLCLDVVVENLRAYKTYRKAGFAPTGFRLEGFIKNGISHDLVLMEYKWHRN